MTRSIEEILALAKPPESVVTLCLRGDLAAEYERLQAQLETASTDSDSLGELSPAATVRQRMADIAAEMGGAQVEFKMRAIGSKAWSDLFAVKPDPPVVGEDGEIDPSSAAAFRDAWHLWVCECVARTCYDPVMTAAQVDELSALLSDGQWIELSDKAYQVNVRSQAVPFSDAVSAPLPAITGKRRRRTS